MTDPRKKELDPESRRIRRRFWLVIFVILGAILLIAVRPYDGSVQLRGLRGQLLRGADFACQTGMGADGEPEYAYCQLPAGDTDFIGLCRFDEWSTPLSHRAGEPVVSVYFSEGYYLVLYDSGYACASNEYGARLRRGERWYKVPADVPAALTGYLAEHGEPAGENAQAAFDRAPN